MATKKKVDPARKRVGPAGAIEGRDTGSSDQSDADARNPQSPATDGRRRIPTTDETFVLLPSQVSWRVGFFDRFAGAASVVASRALFFTVCVLLILVWAPTIFIISSVDTWQLVINTVTSVVTFLLVALLQNSQTRSDQAVQHKLNALADGLADVMEYLANADAPRDIRRDVRELRAAVGLEEHESTTHNAARGRDRGA